MTKKSAIALLDIGKTNVKICLLAADDGQLLAVFKRLNKVLDIPPYPQLDIEGIWHWFTQTIKTQALHFHIQQLACTTHGATAVCLGADNIALPVLDYESAICRAADDIYDPLRPGYAQSLSPALGVGLNIGRQLHWQAQQYPEDFAQVKHILMYPQYWGWRMCGVLASEVTSLGCHTDLWHPQQSDFSCLVYKMRWQALFPRLLKAGATLGPILPAVAEELGLTHDCYVINGIHDSNASLIPYLKAKKAPCTVISTGTWVVIAAIGAPLTHLKEQCDMLANVNAFGDPVPCIRFMGGREWRQLATEQNATDADLRKVMALGVQALPAFSEQGGPFNPASHAVEHGRRGKLCGPSEKLTDAQHTALASLYCAFVTHYCLDLVQGTALGDIFVEGSFAGNDIYLSVLAALNPRQPLYASEDSTGTTLGTALSIEQCNWSIALPQERPVKLDAHLDVEEYYCQWLRLVSSHSGTGT